MSTQTQHNIENLEPKPVWQLFAGMAQVPRPSKKEERIQAHVRKVAERKGFRVQSDKAGNLVIEVPATPGHENAPVTVLQGHLDMVCEKNSNIEHDFETDPIRMIIDKDPKGKRIVRADGTTLGADNGIGVCMALAAATEPDVVHGPLEILCTADEEQGMSGAKALSPELIKGRRMINLDSEEDDVLYMGCAGGTDVNLNWEFDTQKADAKTQAARVSVSGLRGGHSGGDIHLNRGNAIKALAWALCRAREQNLQIAEISGGRLRNAIPREAHAVVIAAAGSIDKLTGSAEKVQQDLLSANGESSCSISVQVHDKPVEQVVAENGSRQMIQALIGLPNGVQAVVPEIPGLVQTSNNVSSMTSENSKGKLRVHVGCLARSSCAVGMKEIVSRIKAVGKLAGAALDTDNEYPGWQPNVDSPLLATCRKLYQELFNETPNVTAIHAGLECGIIGERVKGMDTISFGPRIEGAHSPDERVYIESVQKSWKFLKTVLEKLALE